MNPNNLCVYVINIALRGLQRLHCTFRYKSLALLDPLHTSSLCTFSYDVSRPVLHSVTCFMYFLRPLVFQGERDLTTLSIAKFA